MRESSARMMNGMKKKKKKNTCFAPSVLIGVRPPVSACHGVFLKRRTHCSRPRGFPVLRVTLGAKIGVTVYASLIQTARGHVDPSSAFGTREKSKGDAKHFFSCFYGYWAKGFCFFDVHDIISTIENRIDLIWFISIVYPTRISF